MSVAARQVLGPAMLLLGLHMLGAVRLPLSAGHRLAETVEHRARRGAAGAFTLGVAFSFAFCPTLFLLFFGLTMPLALASPLGVLFPPAFALGTVVPLLGLVGLFAGAGTALPRGRLAGARRLGLWLNRAAGLVLVLAGASDAFTYWLL